MPQTALSILTGGLVDMEKFFAYVGPTEAATWHVVNLNEILHKDPGTVVGHKEDCEHHRTQQVVMSQAGFPDLIEFGLRAASGFEPETGLNGVHGSNKMLFVCRTGFHRASTVGKTMESYGNKLTDADGERRFNCMTFPMHKAVGLRDLHNVADRAVKWAEIPWTAMAYTGDNESDVFGFEACLCHPEACACWTELYGRLKVGWDPSDHASAGSSDNVARDSGGRGGDGRSTGSIGPPWRMQITEKACPPIAAPLSILAQCPSTPPRPPTPVNDDVDDSHDGAEVVDDGADDMLLPEWATTEADVEVWWQSFDRWGVDTNARKALYALAQYSAAGYMKANAIVGKLIKKDTDADLPRNTSAFVHASVMHARNDMDPWRGAAKRARKH
jgi:hypothetical protein